MTFDQLIDFLTNKMKMSHIYQPLLVRSLVDAGGSATLRQLATYFLSQDESQLLYYEKRIKEMPIKVLAKHGIVDKVAAADNSVIGFNVGMNCGESAGQTIFHAHTHLIPRRKGDVEHPRGGVRHVILGKGNY